MRMNWLVRAVALPIILTLAAPAFADSDGGPGTWTLITTAEGCKAYWEYFTEYETEAVMLKRNRFSWKGSGCNKGKLIVGEGTLTKTIDDDGIYPHVFKGRMVDGVLDGPVTYIDALNETHSWTYQMGCIVYGNQVDRNCTPRQRLATQLTIEESEDGPSAWAPDTTAEGCVIYWQYLPKYVTEAEAAEHNRFSWAGTACDSGRPLSGNGTLTRMFTIDGGEFRVPYTGSLVDGALNGPVSVGPAGDKEARQYRMGCQLIAGKVEEGCTPRQRLATGTTPADRLGPIMEEPWNGVGKPPMSPAPAKRIGVKGKAKDKPVPHLSDDQKVLNEILRLTTPSSPKTEADARYYAELADYEQKLAAQQKAVADFEAAERQVAADKAAAAAKASAAQEEFARKQAAYQAEQDRYAREQAEYQAQLAGGPLPAGVGNGNNLSTSGPGGGTTVPPLRPTATLEDHNPANEASHCLDLIINRDFEARGVSSVMGAVFRNSCPFPVETRWCIGANRCATGYDNLATMPASNDRGISYDEPAPGTTTETRWAGCRLGFAYRPDFAGTLHYACK